MEKIKKKRNQLGMTRKQVAEYVGISIHYLDKLENGQRDNPSKEIQRNFAELYQTTVDELFF